MSLTRRGVVLLVTSAWFGWFGCQGPNDTVLQADATGGTGAAGKSAADGGASAMTGGAAGTSAASGSAAGSGGKTPMAGSAGATGRDSGTAGMAGGGSGTGAQTAAGTGAAAGESGAAGGAGTAAQAGASGGTAAGSGGDPAPGAQDPDCDLTGIWAAKQVTVSEALSLPQSSNNWYYLEFKQSGTMVEVSRHFDCGIEVSGSATVTLSRKTLEGLLTHNLQVGRKGTITKDGANCKFDGAKFWDIRGADEQRFLPNATRDSEDSIEQVQAAKPLPTPDHTDGAVDTESDGKLGVAFQVSGIITGTRNSVQRDWTKWFTETGYEIPASTNWTTDLKIRADFDNEESILDPTSGLLVSGSTPKAGAKHILRLRFLGRDASDPRVAKIVKGTDVDTCYAIQDALPVEQLE